MVTKMSLHRRCSERDSAGRLPCRPHGRSGRRVSKPMGGADVRRGFGWQSRAGKFAYRQLEGHPTTTSPGSTLTKAGHPRQRVPREIRQAVRGVLASRVRRINTELTQSSARSRGPVRSDAPYPSRVRALATISCGIRTPAARTAQNRNGRGCHHGHVRANAPTHSGKRQLVDTFGLGVENLAYGR